MGSGAFSGGIVFVVAALLWAAVLVPTWVRRREFKAAEQNALRLQRTLRVLAETAEVPTEVRVEATAREALAQEKLLRTAQRRQEAERKAKLAEARAAQVRAEMRAQQMKRKQAALVRQAKLRRPWVRRVRSIAALVLLLGFVAALVGVGLGIAGLGFTTVYVGLAALVLSLGFLVLLAPGRVKHVDIAAEHLPTAVKARPAAAVTTKASESAEDRAAAAHAAAQAAAAARIDRARAMARARAAGPEAAPKQNQPHSMLLQVAREQAAVQRVNDEESGVAQTAAAGAAAAVAAARKPVAPRLSEMGVIGDTAEGALDLDAVLRSRRRAS